MTSENVTPTGDDWFCDKGVCAAQRGHDGTCAEASGWDEEWHPNPSQARALAFVSDLVKQHIRPDEPHS